MKRVVFFFLGLILFLVTPLTVNASSNTPSDYNITYTISQNTNTRVNVNVTLTNQDNNSYFSSYELKMGFSDIKNLSASDSKGSLNPKLEKDNKGYRINLTFNDVVVGEGKKLGFNLSFDTNEVAQNRGNVWEINIPGISSKNDFGSFNVTVIYPAGIGNPVYIKPNVPGALSRVVNKKLTFTKRELGTSGISIAFGEYQIYKFDLSYHLKNSNLFPVKTEIAIPPETNYQEVIIDQMTPNPNNVRIDNDGNWLAEYTLNPSETKNVKVIGKAKVNLNPKEEIFEETKRREYLSQKPYWETSDPKIKKLAKELNTPYAIYQYIVKNLNYDFSRVTSKEPRLGAKQVLDNPKSAVCLEFTDLFIALARAAGIPAREINGFAYTKNTDERPLSLVKDVLHAWPEYYDNTLKTWVMIDPTWGNTTGGVDYFFTLDLDHLTFIRKGGNSSYPIPPGGYKLSENDNRKDVNVELTSNFEEIESYEVVNEFNNNQFSLTPVEGIIKIQNTGNSVLLNKKAEISTDFLTPKKQILSFLPIPPFGFSEKNISFNKVDFLTNRTDVITIQVGEIIKFANVKISPIYLSKNLLIGGIIFVISAVIISIGFYKSWSIFIHRRKQQDPLHR